jgi:dolichol-phosphate mannosyltransferase
MGRDSVILIPAYNPPDNMISYLEDLRKNGFTRIVIVDDGSREDRQHVFKEALKMGFTILHHDKNSGKGCALRSGFEYYMQKCHGKYDGVILVNSDGRDRAEDCVKIAAALAGEKAKKRSRIIIGSRDFNSPGADKVTKRCNALMSFFFSFLFGQHLNDVLSGFRGIPDSQVLRCLRYSEKTYCYDMAVLIGFERKGYKEISVPVLPANPEAEKHFHPLWDTLLINLVVWKKMMIFGATSIAASVVDLFLFWLLTEFILRGASYRIICATILARIVSASVNYHLSRKYVFRSNESRRKSLRQFMGLAACQCLISAFSVHLLEAVFNTRPILLKILIDSFLFFAAYKVQDKFIFKRT